MFDATKSKFRSITFQTVNIDEQGDLAAKYGVKGIPRVVMLGDGDKVLYNAGAFADVEGFTEKINSIH